MNTTSTTHPTIRPFAEAYWAVRLVLLSRRLSSRHAAESRGTEVVPIHIDLKVQHDDDGRYVGTVPQFPGLVVDGGTICETIYHAAEASYAYLKSLVKHNEPLPSAAKQIFVGISTLYTKLKLSSQDS